MHDSVANDVEHGCDSSSSEQENKVQKVVSTPSKHKVEFKVSTPSKHKVEFKVDAEIFNLETIIDFHPTIRKAKEVLGNRSSECLGAPECSDHPPFTLRFPPRQPAPATDNTDNNT